MIKAAKSGDWSVDDAGVVTAGGIALQEGEYTLETTLADHDGTADAAAGESRASGLLSDGGFVVLDTAITPELAAEGIARDVIRAVQQARRDAGLDITDRIRIRLAAEGDDVRHAVETHRRLIMDETLALAIDEAAAAETGDPVPVGDGQSLRIRIEKA